MNDSHSRRTVLKWMGIKLALPLASHLMPGRTSAQRAPQKNFVAVYFPNGAHMPSGQNGNWTFDDALAPLGAYRDRAMLVRGLYNGFSGIDPHWQNCAGFLSCHPIELGDPGVARCAKSLDQYVADSRPSTLRSLEIGGSLLPPAPAQRSSRIFSRLPEPDLLAGARQISHSRCGPVSPV